ncbi:TPA: molecular chaperone [Escherichia coli]|nr:molecular chaperone [Escherichia coli]
MVINLLKICFLYCAFIFNFGKKMDALCDGMSRDVKNRTSDTIANLLADKFYQKHIDSDIDIVKLRNDIPDYLMRAIQG